MGLFENAFTNIFWEGEVEDMSPDAEGDFYLVTDAQVDQNYWHSKIVDALIATSADPTAEFQIITGGIISDGGSGTVNISECVAISVDDNGNKRLVHIPTLTGIALPTGWNDGRQIWAIAKYDFKLGTLTRSHKSMSTSYHYQGEDTYFGDSNGYASTSTDDLFVDSDPTGDAAIMGSFTMTSTTFADLSSTEKSPSLYGSESGSVVIHTQAQFNVLLNRVSANCYEIRDGITDVKVRNLSGGYLMSGALTGGDTWGYIQTNAAMSIEFTGGAYINFGDNPGYIEVNTEGACLRNVWAKGTGSVAAAVEQSFLLNAPYVTFDNCRTSNRNSNSGTNFAGFRGSVTAAHNYTSEYINCRSHDINGSAYIYGYHSCYNMSACIAYSLTSTSDAYGFGYCYQLASCRAGAISSSGSRSNGFGQCNQLSSCIANTITNSGDSSYANGFDTCSQLSACLASKIDAATNGYAIGFNTCLSVSGCCADDIDASTGGSAWGFYGCYPISACRANDIDAPTATKAHGFYVCGYGSALHTDEAYNGSNDYIDTTDTNVTNKVSCPAVFT